MTRHDNPDIYAGRRVGITRDSYRRVNGVRELQVCAGAEGTVRSVFRSPFDTMAAVVDFPGVPGVIAGLGSLRPINSRRYSDILRERAGQRCTFECEESDVALDALREPPADDAKARRLSNAHSSVSRRYSELATAHAALADAERRLAVALDNLKEVEQS